jgi:hypothetical protein
MFKSQYVEMKFGLNKCNEANKIIFVFWLLFLAVNCKGESKSMSELVDSNKAAEISQAWVQRIMTTKEIALPDEWYQITSDSTSEHFDGMIKIIKEQRSLSSADQTHLMELLENNGHPVSHRIFFNRPMPPCSKCESVVGEGLITVISFKNDIFVELELSELHEILEHDGKFSPTRLKQIQQVFQ